jgi:endonuclease/exonuclease/phosphatase family metal-dependent hydrolase
MTSWSWSWQLAIVACKFDSELTEQDIDYIFWSDRFAVSVDVING